MNIGLLISELEDKEVKKICIGANQAARDKNVTLIIMPGKYLITDNEEENPYDYQHMAVFDYANTEDFDVLIVDIDRIGKGAPILKRDAFLNKFSGIPLLTLTKQEGLDVEVMSVNEVETDHDQFEQLGYEAVCDAVYYAINKSLPQNEPAMNFSFVDKSASEAISTISKIGKMLLRRKYAKEKVYEIFADITKRSGLNTCAIYLYDQKIRNTIKYWWKRPENICVKSALVNGNIEDIKDAHKVVKISEIISGLTDNKPTVLVAGAIFVGEYQLGLLITP